MSKNRVGRIEKKDLLKGNLIDYLSSKYRIEEIKPKRKFISVTRNQKRA